MKRSFLICVVASNMILALPILAGANDQGLPTYDHPPRPEYGEVKPSSATYYKLFRWEDHRTGSNEMSTQYSADELAKSIAKDLKNIKFQTNAFELGDKPLSTAEARNLAFFATAYSNQPMPTNMAVTEGIFKQIIENPNDTPENNKLKAKNLFSKLSALEQLDRAQRSMIQEVTSQVKDAYQMKAFNKYVLGQDKGFQSEEDFKKGLWEYMDKKTSSQMKSFLQKLNKFSLVADSLEHHASNDLHPTKTPYIERFDKAWKNITLGSQQVPHGRLASKIARVIDASYHHRTKGVWGVLGGVFVGGAAYADVPDEEVKATKASKPANLKQNNFSNLPRGQEAGAGNNDVAR